MSSEQIHIESVSPAATFPRFPRMPREVRCMVWQHSWLPRFVSITRQDVTGLVEDFQGELDARRYQALAQLREWGSQFYVDSLDGISCGNPGDERSEYAMSGDEKSDDGMGDVKMVGVEMSSVEHQRSPSDDHHLVIKTITRSNVNPPASAWVNKESRGFTRRHYELCLGLDGGESRVYFNFDLDSLVLTDCTSPYILFQHGDLERLQRAAIASTTLNPRIGYMVYDEVGGSDEDDWPKTGSIEEFMTSFPRLKEVILFGRVDKSDGSPSATSYECVPIPEFLFQAQDESLHCRQFEDGAQRLAELMRDLPFMSNCSPCPLLMSRFTIDRNTPEDEPLDKYHGENWEVVEPYCEIGYFNHSFNSMFDQRVCLHQVEDWELTSSERCILTWNMLEKELSKTLYINIYWQGWGESLRWEWNFDDYWNKPGEGPKVFNFTEDAYELYANYRSQVDYY
ncbi:hypothetical protein NKR23_g2060 [Pleurostoma richardsiae]|uniref:2EXR domain-containing protein n=1 Tax=Pleurostoma richardsiae TaxID=41990 RepID=A0AA38SC57_9PEZI|nr:hypothetical protein NKR23_g2060 [Pleurostoma richardsiae]